MEPANAKPESPNCAECTKLRHKYAAHLATAQSMAWQTAEARQQGLKEKAERHYEETGHDVLELGFAARCVSRKGTSRNPSKSSTAPTGASPLPSHPERTLLGFLRGCSAFLIERHGSEPAPLTIILLGFAFALGAMWVLRQAWTPTAYFVGSSVGSLLLGRFVFTNRSRKKAYSVRVAQRALDALIPFAMASAIWTVIEASLTAKTYSLSTATILRMRDYAVGTLDFLKCLKPNAFWAFVGALGVVVIGAGTPAAAKWATRMSNAYRALRIATVLLSTLVAYHLVGDSLSRYAFASEIALRDAADQVVSAKDAYEHAVEHAVAAEVSQAIADQVPSVEEGLRKLQAEINNLESPSPADIRMVYAGDANGSGLQEAVEAIQKVNPVPPPSGAPGNLSGHNSPRAPGGAGWDGYIQIAMRSRLDLFRKAEDYDSAQLRVKDVSRPPNTDGAHATDQHINQLREKAIELAYVLGAKDQVKRALADAMEDVRVEVADLFVDAAIHFPLRELVNNAITRCLTKCDWSAVRDAVRGYASEAVKAVAEKCSKLMQAIERAMQRVHRLAAKRAREAEVLNAGAQHAAENLSTLYNIDIGDYLPKKECWKCCEVIKGVRTGSCWDLGCDLTEERARKMCHK